MIRVKSIGISLLVSMLALSMPARGQIPVGTATPPLGEPSAPPPATLVTEARAVAEPDVPPEAAAAIQQFPGLAWVGKLKANGNREVAVLIPTGTDLGEALELIVFFHGSGGSAAVYTGWMGRFAAHFPEHKRNVVFVLPSGGNGTTWMALKAGESLIRLQDQALAAATRLADRRLKVGKYIVEGFSAGGWPIAVAARAGQLRARQVILFDAADADTTVRYRKPGTAVAIFYTRANRWAAPARKYKDVTVEAAPAGTAHGQVPELYFYR